MNKNWLIKITLLYTCFTFNDSCLALSYRRTDQASLVQCRIFDPISNQFLLESETHPYYQPIPGVRGIKWTESFNFDSKGNLLPNHIRVARPPIRVWVDIREYDNTSNYSYHFQASQAVRPNYQLNVRLQKIRYGWKFEVGNRHYKIFCEVFS